MSEEGNTGIKLKIFLIAFLVFITLILGMYSYNFITSNRDYMNKESENSNNCLNTQFEVLKAEYKNQTIHILINNPASSDTELNRISVELNNQTLTKELIIPKLTQKEVLFENIILTQDHIRIYPDNCIEYSKTVNIKI